MVRTMVQDYPSSIHVGQKLCIRNVKILNNHANNGSGLYIQNASPYIYNVEVKNNSVATASTATLNEEVLWLSILFLYSEISE